MSGTNQLLDRVEIVLKDNSTGNLLPVYVDVFDNSLSRKWLDALNNLIKNRKHNHPVINERPNIEDPKHCVLKYDPRNIVDEIPYENFDYEIIKIDSHMLNKTVVNEIWPLLRTLWRAVGEYEINIRFDPDEDAKEFGFRLSSDYTANHKFKIDTSGAWSAEFSYAYKHKPDQWQDCSFTLDWKGTGQW